MYVLVTVTPVKIEYIFSLLLRGGGERGETSIRTLLQHMCTRVTDRAEYRGKVAQSVVTVTQHLSLPAYCAMVQWIHKLSRHTQVHTHWK